MDISLDFEVVSIAEAKLALNANERASPRVAPQVKFVRKETLPADIQLLPETVAWMAALPGEVVPTRCAQHYPRIVNRIQNLWHSPLLTKDFMDDLLISKREGRQGFPHNILPELAALRQYYETLHPTCGQCIWAENDTHRRS